MNNWKKHMDNHFFMMEFAGRRKYYLLLKIRFFRLPATKGFAG
jgi:hypothetical protein